MSTAVMTAPISAPREDASGFTRDRAIWGTIMLAPYVLVFAVMVVYPVGYGLWLGLNWNSYKALFADPIFLRTVVNTVIFLFVAVNLKFLIALGLSGFFVQQRPWIRFVLVLFILPWAVPSIPTILSFVIVGFAWKLILSPLWGVAPNILDLVGLKSLFAPWLGKEAYALTTLGLISVWQFVGIPMMLIYAALLSIPDEVIEAAECDGITGAAQFWKIKLPLVLPAIGIISILTFVGNFNAFDLIYSAQGALAGPNFSTDILGTFLYRTFFGFQLQIGDPHMGSTIASMMFFIILAGVCLYLFAVQTRLRRYQF